MFFIQFTFFRDSRPSKAPPASSPSSKSAGSRSGRIKEVGRNGFGFPSKQSSSESEQNSASEQQPTVRLSEGGRPIRTIILPAGPQGANSSSSSIDSSASPGHADSLAMQCNSLKRQLGDIQRLADERATAYGRDRDTLIDQYERKIGADSAALRQLESQLESAQSKLTQLTKDFLSQRAQYSSTERALREQMAEDRAARELAERELSMTTSQTEAQLASMHAQLDSVIKNSKSQLVSKAEQHNDSVRMITAQWEGEKAALQEQVSTLKDQLKFQKQKNVALDKRRAGEAEGFMHDISQLRRALRQLETQWAIMGNAVSDNAMAEDVREMEAHAAEIATRLSEFDGKETVEASSQAVGRDWLPSRSVNQPALSGIRPGLSLGVNKQQRPRAAAPNVPSPPTNGSTSKSEPTSNRRVVAPQNLKTRSENFAPKSVTASPNKPAPASTQASFATSAQSPQHSQLGGRGGGAFMSPGAAMDLVDSPPPTAIKRAQALAEAARAQLEEEGGTEDDSLELLLRKQERESMQRQTLSGEGEEEEEIRTGSPHNTHSPSTTSAKRVPATAPNAAPRIDPNVFSRRNDDGMSSPGHAAAEKTISATAKMRSQLEVLQDKIVSTSEKMQRLEERS